MAAQTLSAPALPPGRTLVLPKRGTTFVRQVQGPAGAPTLFLLHGWMATADLNWFTAYERLGRHFNVVAIDHRGHGHGIRSTFRPFRLEDCADDVAAAATALGIDSFIPVGYSMGGAIAQLVWRRHRERVDGIVLCATARNFGRRAADRVMFGSMLGLSVAARITPKMVRRSAFDRVVGPRVKGRPLAEWASRELRRNDPSIILQAGWSIGRFSSADWIGGVDVPAGVVMTTRDNVVSPQRQRALADAIPDARVFRVVGDHDVCVTGAARFVPALLDACVAVTTRVATPS